MNVLIVAAHPDDEILGAGGTWHKHKRLGDTVTTMIFSKGRQDKIDQNFDLMSLRAVITEIEKIVKKYEPSVVYTHSSKDINNDHKVIHDAVKVACRPTRSPVKAIYGFDSTMSAFDTIQPNHYVELKASDVTWKAKQMLKKYKAEMSVPVRTYGGIETQAIFWGDKIGAVFAEAFETIMEIV